jgi:hypothetical protein
LTTFVKKRLEIAVFLLAVFGLHENVCAQTYGTANHRITVTVATITQVQVSIGSLSLTISGASAVAGQNSMSTTDQSSLLKWGINSSLKKITVNSNLATPLFTLNVLALTPTQGTASPEVTLSTTASDFLINLGRTVGQCTLRYTGVALASQGTGSDAHTITYTVITQ